MAKAKKDFTDRYLLSLKPESKLRDYMDNHMRGLGIRVSPTGRKTFILIKRFPRSPHPVRRALGEYGTELTLEEARDKARDWLKQIKKHKDPKKEEEREKIAAERKRKNSFRLVLEDFAAAKLGRERSGAVVKRDLEAHFLKQWNGDSIADKTAEDIAYIIREKASTPACARNILGSIKRLFQWAVDTQAYGITVNPAAMLKPAALCGEKIARSRKLDDDEVFAFLRAANRMPYPYGPIYR